MPRKKIVISPEECERIRKRYEEPTPLLEMEKEFGYSRPILRTAIVEAGGAIRSRGKLRKAIKCVPVLKNKMHTLSQMLGHSLNDDVIQLLVDYVLRFNDGRTFGKIDRRYDYNGILSQFRKDHLEPNYYIMGKLWRAVYRLVTYEGTNLAPYNVAEYDVNLCLKYLSEENRKRIIEWTKYRRYVYLPNEEGVHKVVASCEKSITSIVNSKLRFIHKYDPCYEKEDLEGYLRGIAYKVALKYDWEMVRGSFDFEKCLNYTKRSLWNAAFLLIKQNTSKDYARLAKVDTDQRVYQVTTISLDSAPEDDWASIQDRIGTEQDSFSEVVDLVENMDHKCPGIKKYLNLEMENDPVFSAFVLNTTGMDENDLYVRDFNKWRMLAMHFSGIGSAARKKLKRQVLKELGLWYPSKESVKEQYNDNRS